VLPPLGDEGLARVAAASAEALRHEIAAHLQACARAAVAQLPRRTMLRMHHCPHCGAGALSVESAAGSPAQKKGARSPRMRSMRGWCTSSCVYPPGARLAVRVARLRRRALRATSGACPRL